MNNSNIKRDSISKRLVPRLRSVLAPGDIKAKRKPVIFKCIRDILVNGVELFSDKPLYIYRRDKTECHVTYREFRDMVNYVGTAFSELGLMGATVAVIGDSCPEYMAAYHAAVSGNGVIVPLDRDLSDEALKGFLTECGAEAVVYTEGQRKRFPTLIEGIDKIRYVFPVGNGIASDGEKVISFNDLIETGRRGIKEGNREYLDCKPVMDKMSVLLFTSGTTGTSKGVMLSHHNLIAGINASVQSTEYDDDDTFVDLLPLHHSYEMTCCQFGVAAVGGTMYINESIKSTMRSITGFKPTTLIVVPLYVETMYKRIWTEIDKKKLRGRVELAMKFSDSAQYIGIDLRKRLFGEIQKSLGGNLRSIVCGGAHISPELVRNFNRFGIAVFEGYGITECSPLVAVNRSGKRKLGSVGQPVYGCMVKIDKTEGSDTGEILVKGDNVMLGYFNNEEANKEAFTEDGWFRTGDIGYMDDDNYIFITGRKKNVIILSNGKNIFPEELEEHMSHKEIICESVVVPRKKHDTGEITITAIIYPDPAVTKDMTGEEEYEAVKAAVDEVNRDLPLYKQIHDIEIRDTEFEKTTTRKIKRFLVK